MMRPRLSVPSEHKDSKSSLEQVFRRHFSPVFGVCFSDVYLKSLPKRTQAVPIIDTACPYGIARAGQ